MLASLLVNLDNAWILTFGLILLSLLAKLATVF